nr:uncharacterized protein LOC127345932 [Lolium perenne]
MDPYTAALHRVHCTPLGGYKSRPKSLRFATPLSEHSSSPLLDSQSAAGQPRPLPRRREPFSATDHRAETLKGASEPPLPSTSEQLAIEDHAAAACGGVPARAGLEAAFLRPSSTSTTPPAGGRRAPEPPFMLMRPTSTALPATRPSAPSTTSSPAPGRRASVLHRVPALLPRRLHHLRTSQIRTLSGLKEGKDLKKLKNLKKTRDKQANQGKPSFDL